MALPADRNSGESTAGFAPRLVPTPFLTKTYQLVDDHAIDNVISWNADGSTFIVWNPTEFARDLLPKYFKHNNFSSFVRQLSTYGFSKIVQDRWEFSNECFRRGQKNLLCDIQRRKIAAPPSTVLPAPSASPLTVSPSDSGEEQVFPSSISQPAIHKLRGSTAELIGENKMLREKNAQLNKELSHMKNLCNHIYLLMSNCTNINNSNRNDGYQDHSCKLFSAETAVKPLDLLPMTRFCEEIAAANCGEGSMIRSAAEEISARVFGVPMGPERGRESEVTSAMDLQLQLPGGDIKYEPLDEDERVDNQESSLTRAKWRNLCN